MDIKNINKRNVFILEGPDAAGKTTLAEGLSKLLKYPIYHCTYYKDPVQMNSQFLDVLALIKKGKVIIDRFILSNEIYSDVFKCPRNLTDSTIRECENALSLPNVHSLICLPDKYTWMDTFKNMCDNREEMWPDLEKQKDIYDKFFDVIKYNTLSHGYKCNCSRFNYEDGLFDIRMILR